MISLSDTHRKNITAWNIVSSISLTWGGLKPKGVLGVKVFCKRKLWIFLKIWRFLIIFSLYVSPLMRVRLELGLWAFALLTPLTSVKCIKHTLAGAFTSNEWMVVVIFRKKGRGEMMSHQTGGLVNDTWHLLRVRALRMFSMQATNN